MMENAIDAGARSVKVNFRDGGKDLIQIVDDGCGMSPIDARMAFDRHATSKIASVDDIYALHTFGFRGEALASIAAVAQVELRTRQEGDETGTETLINGGTFAGQHPVACAVGSQFSCATFFYNVPARRRFLEKKTTSATQIRTEFQRVALCNPKVHFELYNNDAPVYNLAPGSTAARIVDVIGRHIRQNLLEVEADTSIARIEGICGASGGGFQETQQRAVSVRQWALFQQPYLAKAVLKAYEKLIPESCTPSFFLYLTIDPSRIDVNVSPQKTEVKFADEEAVWQIVHAAVRETLGKTGAVPMMDFDEAPGVEIPVLRQGPCTESRGPCPMRITTLFARSMWIMRPRSPRWSSRGSTCLLRRGRAFERLSRGGFVVRDPGASRGAGRCGRRGVFESAAFGGSELEFIPSASDEPQQQRLELDGKPRFSDVVPVGGGLAVARYGGRLVAADLRRARERVLYENYLVLLGNGSSVSQQLLFLPERLVLSEEEYALMEENAVEFAGLGFDVDYCGGGAVEVRGTPADMPADAIDRLLYELLQAFDTPHDLADVRREKIARVMARNAARAPRSVSRLRRLRRCSISSGRAAIAASRRRARP